MQYPTMMAITRIIIPSTIHTPTPNLLNHQVCALIQTCLFERSKYFSENCSTMCCDLSTGLLKIRICHSTSELTEHFVNLSFYSLTFKAEVYVARFFLFGYAHTCLTSVALPLEEMSFWDFPLAERSLLYPFPSCEARS